MQHDFILLDRSQSMSDRGKWEEALGAVNAYVKKLAEDKVDTGVTLATFDKDMGKLQFDVIRDRIIPSTWKEVTNADASPRGYTPLNDAIGRIVALADQGVPGTNNLSYEKAAIIIVTDGEENSSQELNHAQAKALLDRCRQKGWQVIFLGADYDNVDQATSYGTRSAQTVSASVANMKTSMRYAASKRGLYGSGAAATMDFTDEEKAELRK